MSTTRQTVDFLRHRFDGLRATASAGVLGSAVWVTEAAHAVNDLPGGPAVNQLNFAPPATKIAEE